MYIIDYNPTRSDAVCGPKSRKSLGRTEFKCRFGARMDVQLVVDVLEMPAHGGNGHAQALSDFLVGHAVNDQFQYRNTVCAFAVANVSNT